MKKILPYIVLVLSLNLPALAAENSRSDTLDILHYTITLKITDFTGKKISGNCKILIASKINNLTRIDLDLLRFTVDSVKNYQTGLNYSYNDTLLSITTLSPLMKSDTISITVFYQGIPPMDPSGWGGFYFSGNYAFNLGVGFESYPHVFGRAWFPCVDNFVERSTYEFFITTKGSMKAFCNGLLQEVVDNGDLTNTWHWKMNQTIPTYLASVAVSYYKTVNMTYQGLNGPIPVQFGAATSDTSKMKTSFKNLFGCIDGFENSYGPHRFDRIGFNLVPFNSGAMEHATNISYPQYAADGTLSQEDLYAHELSHHWWGDLITCETQEDMWINEGMASYSEYIFWENVYGKEKYRQKVVENLETVLHMAHINDNGYRAIYGIPKEYTYGDHVYQKGSQVAHTLRAYMGDSLFFHCLKQLLNTYSFNSVNTIQVRDFLTSCSEINLSPFFEQWIFNPGFPHFEYDSVVVEKYATWYRVSLRIQQRTKEAPEIFTDVPMEITFLDKERNEITEKVIVPGECLVYKTHIPFNPAMIILDRADKISDAITSEEKTLKVTGNSFFNYAQLSLNVSKIQDSALFRVEHNWIAPTRKGNLPEGFHLSDARYWKIDGIFPDSLQGKLTFKYNGANASGGYLDNSWITNSEDSIALMFRTSTDSIWKIHPDYTLNIQSSATNKIGQIVTNNILKGYYAFGIYDASRSDTFTTSSKPDCISIITSQPEENRMIPDFSFYPNPVIDYIQVILPREWHDFSATIFDNTGRVVMHRYSGSGSGSRSGSGSSSSSGSSSNSGSNSSSSSGSSSCRIYIKNLPEGIYILKVSGGEVNYYGKVVVLR
ncbi:MAG: hypothetical protein A3G23_03345 [Bacteroidetes bacterium RIFCSPLOWO2_12_FULL_37_12]|nr:MAG: hypothetical protein A3G23_03345 [Bacteroidetes bacterium RIFCSPLOWO2_12_FULL_37_12]